MSPNKYFFKEARGPSKMQEENQIETNLHLEIYTHQIQEKRVKKQADSIFKVNKSVSF